MRSRILYFIAIATVLAPGLTLGAGPITVTQQQGWKVAVIRKAGVNPDTVVTNRQLGSGTQWTDIFNVSWLTASPTPQTYGCFKVTADTSAWIKVTAVYPTSLVDSARSKTLTFTAANFGLYSTDNSACTAGTSYINGAWIQLPASGVKYFYFGSATNSAITLTNIRQANYSGNVSVTATY